MKTYFLSLRINFQTQTLRHNNIIFAKIYLVATPENLIKNASCEEEERTKSQGIYGDKLDSVASIL